MSSTIVGWFQQRRYVLLAAALAVAVAVSLIVTQQQGRATSGGTPYSVPNVVDVNSDPNVVETTIVADETTVNLGQGVTAHAQTYNGTIPGPTFHLKVGDVVIVHYENHLDKPSAIHWHGIELPNSMDGTPFTQNQVEPGGTFLYRFAVNRPGLFWYHPHHHSSTNQVFRGLYGMIIVDDPSEAALQQSLTIPPKADTHPVVLSDVTVCKQQGQNPTNTYPTNAPHVSGASPFPAQEPPTPKDLCETTPIDENGATRGPYSAGDIPAIQTAISNGRTNEGNLVLTNGKNVGARAGTPAAPGALAAGAETMDVQARQGVRLQLLNAAAIRYFRLRLTTSTGTIVPLTRIGGEGGLLNNAVDEGGLVGAYDTKYTHGEILLPPGSRADVAFGIPASATGVLTLWTEDFTRTGKSADNFYANTATVPVMHFKVGGSAPSTFSIAGGDAVRQQTGNLVETLGAANGNLLNPNTFSPAKLGMASQNVILSKATNPKDAQVGLGINSVFGTHEVSGDYTGAAHLGSSRYAKEGDRLQLTVDNMTGAHHPFHLHGFSIQPKSLVKDGGGGPDFTWTYPEFMDNVDIPPGYTLTFRIRLDPRPMPDGTTPGGALGRWVFHCHIFFHATNGMLSELVVTSPTGKERPDVNVDAATATVEQDQTASIGGTFFDRDGEAVTISASTGNVTFGAGKWAWTKATSATDGGGGVYITATDAGGLKSQIAFELNVTNTPPSLVLPGDQSVPIGGAHTDAVSVNDPNTTDTIALSATGLPQGLSFGDNHNRTGVVSGTVTASPGDYVATFSADDGKHAPVTSTVKYTVTASGKLLTGIVNKPEVMRKRSITVGCRLVVATIKSCRATVLRKGKQVGRNTRMLAATGTQLANVDVPLARSLRRRV